MRKPLWTGNELLEICGLPTGGDLPGEVTGVSIDTRTLQPGELFFAIQGDRTDGHDYLEQAFAAGAAAAVVDYQRGLGASGPLLQVTDTLEALRRLARAARARSDARIVAVTGSVGKTSTKEMLRLMLGRIGTVHASDKSYNNHWGVPLSLARLPRDADYAVFEIGMNHPGEIVPLTQLVRPHVAVITTVAPVHIEFFDSVESIARAKAEIFEGVEGGQAILNRDNEFFPLLVQLAADASVYGCIGFGSAEDAEWRLEAIEPQGGGSRIIARDVRGARAITYRLGAPGEHLAMNSVAALAAVDALGGDAEQAAKALIGFTAPDGRGAQSLRRIEGGTFLLIDEAYNANPASVGAALKVLGGLSRQSAGRRVAVLGDMLELGARSDALHAALAAAIEAEGIDTVYCCGPHMHALFEALPEARRGGWAESSEALRDTLLGALRSGDAVTVKGSLGSRMGLIVEAIKTTYPSSSPPGGTAAA
jgi:UDP-N-acetylmuramoyl-tripeptide--D-alanyl-D-alanine ligase